MSGSSWMKFFICLVQKACTNHHYKLRISLEYQSIFSQALKFSIIKKYAVSGNN